MTADGSMFTTAVAALAAAAAAIFSRSARCFASTSRPFWMAPSMACAASASADDESTFFSSATTRSICGSPYASSSWAA